MTRRVRNIRVAALVISLALFAGACGGDDDTAQTTDAAGDAAEKLSGAISIDGSSTVAPLTEAVAEEYRAEQADVQVTVGTSGTGGGFKKFCADETDIANASRPIKAEEIADCEKKSITFEEFRVGLDGLALVTSSSNDFLECLDKTQLASLYKDGGVKSWDQVDPKFPKQPIALFGPGTDSGTYDFFVEEVLGAPDDEGSLKPRTDYTASEDDNTLVQGVAGEKNGFAYFGFAYYTENKDKLKVVKLKGEDGTCVEPSDTTVADSSYELSRPLFIYAKGTSLARPEVADFVRYYLTTTPDLIGEVGYTPAPAADYEAGLAKLEA